METLARGAPWRDRIVRATLLSTTRVARCEGVLAIPARDESARIERCLDACLDSVVESRRAIELLVLVNGNVDDTSERVLAWSDRRGRPITLVETQFRPEAAHAGAARGLALALAGVGVAPDTPLLTTDADATPPRDWVRRNLAHLADGARLVCGGIHLEPREASHLPDPLTDGGDVAERYKDAMRELEHRLDPDPWNRWPHHGESGGASLALARSTLEGVGGVPFVPCGEDRALAARLRGRGECVRYAADVSVAVSCRLHGRARGGMADTIRQRLFDPDPPCDEAYREAHRVEKDARLAAAIRATWSRRPARERLLRAHGVPPGAAARLGAVDEVADVLAACRAIGSPSRLRASDLRRELPLLLALIERTEGRECAWPICPA